MMLLNLSIPMKEFFNRFREQFEEQRATDRARQEFELWQQQHPTEASLLEILDTEFKHRNKVELRISPQFHAEKLEETRQARRALGFGDNLVDYVRISPELLPGILNGTLSLTEVASYLLPRQREHLEAVDPLSLSP